MSLAGLDGRGGAEDPFLAEPVDSLFQYCGRLAAVARVLCACRASSIVRRGRRGKRAERAPDQRVGGEMLIIAGVGEVDGALGPPQRAMPSPVSCTTQPMYWA
ncbi:hypothetical protein LUW74_37600 [Actinomadura madurae]|uniref:hypothetical protein n=1 Tax=Actinomadura madurae TaxID=1993 RepID=UPI0020268A5A|nr:hypothetical protein [Actinomadura madurae]URN10928.1 hypothetical protein LUW74_37600 [Actinomadura madurae]